MSNEALMRKTLRTFYESIWGSMTGNVIVGLRDKPGPRGKVNRFEDYKYPEQLDEVIEWSLSHRNEDVYASPLIYGDERTEPDEWNPNGKLRRTPENALYSLTIYQDSDTCEPDNFRFRPSIHIQSSSGRYQDYWVLTEPVTAQEAANVSHRIAIAHREHGSDPSSWSANKVLRVPLTTNTTHGFPEDVLVWFTGDIYDYLDLSGGYDDIELIDRPIIRLPADVSYDTDQDLPDYADALDKLPEGFDVEALTKEVPADVDRSRMRYRLLCDLFRAGTLSFEDVLSLAWHAPASRKWKEDPRNLRGLIQEALKAQAEVAYETGEGITGPEDTPKLGAFDIPLLTDSERASIAGDENWLKRWDEWNRAKLGRTYNHPYVEMNGLSILSAAFSDSVYLPMSNGEEPCGIYVMGVGDSGSGKSSHKKLFMEMMHEMFEDSAWRLSGNASPNALHEALLNRDRKVTILVQDEAHGWFSQLNAGSQSWTAGTLEMLAEFYDGDVPPMHRTGNRDISGKSAKCYFGIHALGTKKGKLSITNVLTDDMIYSGFLARFIWYLGENREVSEDSMDVNMTNGDYVQLGYEPMCRQWSAEFANTKKLLKVKYKKTRFGIPWDRDAIARVGQMKWKIDRAFRNKHPKWELLDPSIRRLGPNMMRVAALLAAEEAGDSVTLRHVLLAMEMCESWLKNLVTMTENISASDWKRQCNQILEFIASKGAKARREVVLRKFSDRKGRELGEQLNDLIQQGMLKEVPGEKGVKWLALKE